MNYKATLTIEENGQLVLDQLPFQPGERVEVTIESSPSVITAGNRFPLRGTPYEYEAPFESALPVEDWSVYQ